MSTGKVLAGIPDVPERQSSMLQMPSGLHAAVNVASADAIPDFTNCRYCYVDVAGIVKFGYEDPSDGVTHVEYKHFAAGDMCPIRNVSVVYKTGTTAQIYTDAGSTVLGLKVRK